MIDTCVLPGCDTHVEDPTLPCEACLTLFQGYLRENDERTLTPESIAQRDRETREAYALQAAAVAPGRASAGADDYLESLAKRQLGRGDIALPQPLAQLVSQTPIRKAMQVCWLCEERRTCTCIDRRWECDRCRETAP